MKNKLFCHKSNANKHTSCRCVQGTCIKLSMSYHFTKSCLHASLMVKQAPGHLMMSSKVSQEDNEGQLNTIIMQLPQVTAGATVRQKSQVLSRNLSRKLLMTALISGDQQPYCISCHPAGVRELQARMCTSCSHFSTKKTQTPHTQQVLHKLLLPSSPHECTHTRALAHTRTKSGPRRGSRG